jgi:predicted site-specific integrase-resolvase
MENLFKHFGTKIIVINDNKNANDKDDLFEELMNIVHLFSTKLYSSRKNKKQTIKYL